MAGYKAGIQGHVPPAAYEMICGLTTCKRLVSVAVL